ncbi:SRPBCC domain-containing protein [Streptomyces shenzhenensis]|uniref:SRPBCC domain-containing protein n=1 Tax=Streptomyces shenzhenensis TaxID=943815 RepID=UPI0033C17A51
MDFRVGGKWRYVMTAEGEFEIAFHGEYREIVPEERIVWTEVFEGVPGMTPEEAEKNAGDRRAGADGSTGEAGRLAGRLG